MNGLEKISSRIIVDGNKYYYDNYAKELLFWIEDDIVHLVFDLKNRKPIIKYMNYFYNNGIKVIMYSPVIIPKFKSTDNETFHLHNIRNLIYNLCDDEIYDKVENKSYFLMNYLNYFKIDNKLFGEVYKISFNHLDKDYYLSGIGGNGFYGKLKNKRPDIYTFLTSMTRVYKLSQIDI